MISVQAAMIVRNGAKGFFRWKTTLPPWALTARATSAKATWIFPESSRVLSTPSSGLRRSHAGPPA